MTRIFASSLQRAFLRVASSLSYASRTGSSFELAAAVVLIVYARSSGAEVRGYERSGQCFTIKVIESKLETKAIGKQLAKLQG